MQILLASGEGNLVLLSIGAGAVKEAGHRKLPSDIACLDITPLEPGGQSAALAAVGTWDHSVHIVALPSLESSCEPEALGDEMIPRSLLFAAFEGISYLLVALGEQAQQPKIWNPNSQFLTTSSLTR